MGPCQPDYIVYYYTHIERVVYEAYSKYRNNLNIYILNALNSLEHILNALNSFELFSLSLSFDSDSGQNPKMYYCDLNTGQNNTVIRNIIMSYTCSHNVGGGQWIQMFLWVMHKGGRGL